jgi:hypothetical protein
VGGGVGGAGVGGGVGPLGVGGGVGAVGFGVGFGVGLGGVGFGVGRGVGGGVGGCLQLEHACVFDCEHVGSQELPLHWMHWYEVVLHLNVGVTAQAVSQVCLSGQPSPAVVCLHEPGLLVSHCQPGSHTCVYCAPAGQMKDCEMSMQRVPVPPLAGRWHQPQLAR